MIIGAARTRTSWEVYKLTATQYLRGKREEVEMTRGTKILKTYWERSLTVEERGKRRTLSSPLKLSPRKEG